MGSGNSKDSVSSSSSSTGLIRSRRARIFHSSCFGKNPGSSDNHDRIEEHDRLKNEICTDQTETDPDQVKHGICWKGNCIGTDQVPSISSNLNFDVRGQETASHTSSGAGSSSTQTVIAQSSNPVSRIRSRFSFLPNNFSFRLNRSASFGSSEAYSPFSTSLTISNTEASCGVRSGSHGSEINNNTHDEEIASHVSQYPNNSIGGLHLGHPQSDFSVHLQNEEIASSQDSAANNIRIGSIVNCSSVSNHTETENFETRRLRRIRAQEPVEGSVQFSRTLSVGRLRDRVLRRTFNEGSFGHLQDASVLGDIRQDYGRPVLGDVAGAASDGNPEMLQALASSRSSSTSSGSLNRRQEYGLDTLQLGGESSNRDDVLEHRAAFLERRRRARSQVFALQRLGSRFQNLAGHERSCILSGQHRTGRCLCRTSTSANSLNDDRSTRASISRIVLLAEALFEVLDEIHQQSVVLSSHPSVSSLGSVPAPKEIVECMPLRTYAARPQKHYGEEVAQCYICLVEYDEGDCMRVLPCHHEFHQTCVDKWLKEIHRVCPLCRGDVCRSEIPTVEKVD